MSGSVWGQVGQGLEQPGLVGGVPARGRELELGENFRAPSNLTSLWFYFSAVSSKCEFSAAAHCNHPSMLGFLFGVFILIF